MSAWNLRSEVVGLSQSDSACLGVGDNAELGFIVQDPIKVLLGRLADLMLIIANMPRSPVKGAHTPSATI